MASHFVTASLCCSGPESDVGTSDGHTPMQLPHYEEGAEFQYFVLHPQVPSSVALKSLASIFHVSLLVGT